MCDKFQNLESGCIGLVQEGNGGKINQIGLTLNQSNLLQIFLGGLSKEKPLVKMPPKYNLVLESEAMGQCPEEFDETICPGCNFFRTEICSHPAGGSVHSVERNSCNYGFWEDNF